MSGYEIRTGDRAPVEFRASDKGPGELAGYAAMFNRESQNLGGFVERIDPAAFNKTIADAGRVMARYNHDDNYLLGTTTAQTLTLELDDQGLRYVVSLPDTSAGRDVAVLAKRGDLTNSSFAFRTVTDDWDTTEQGFPLRTLRAVQLVDVAPVNSPAYLDTTAGMRSLADRVGMDVAALAAAGPDEIRSLLTTPPTVGDEASGGPGETHPLLLPLRVRRLEALARTV